VFPYFCIVHLPRCADRDIQVLKAADDAAARAEAAEIARRWPGFETVVTYSGERVVGVMSNPLLGFPVDPPAWLEEFSRAA